MKKIILILFVFVAIIQLATPVKMILDRESILNNGKVFKFQTEPIDPTDIFRGKYIRLDFTNEIFQFPDSLPNYKCDIYAEVGTDSKGFAEIKHVSLYKPEGQKDFVKAKAYNVYENEKGEQMIRINFPFNRFYMEESKAKPAEDLYNKTWNDSTQIAYALVYVKNGEAVLKDVLINDISIRLLASESLNEQK